MFRTALTVAAAAVALATPLAARSQDKPDGQWHGNASMGGTLSSGTAMPAWAARCPAATTTA
jgi:hypothetical protein